MTTITEDYVTLEVARLLKKKGFDGECRNYIDGNSTYKMGYYVEKPITSNKLKSRETLLPTLQMAIKWLKKKHNICIVSLPVVTDDEGEAGCLWNYIISRKLEVLHNSEFLYYSSEIALNDAIKYCLENLI